MMDNKTLQALIGHFVELKDKINAVKTDIRAVTAGQEELKTDITAVTAGQEELKTDISAVTAGQEELKTDINGVKTDISAVTAGQEELKNNMKSEISAVKNDFENSISAVKGLGNEDKRRPRRIETGNQCLSGENKGRPG
jgi:chromosome segregation ATPase